MTRIGLQGAHSSKVILGVQYLRGMSALAVLFCHLGSNIAGYPKLSSIFFQGQLGVHVFFFVSGFVIVHSLVNHSYEVSNFLPFFFKRSLRIEPVYIVTIVLTLLTFQLLSLIPTFRGTVTPFLPGQFLAHIFYIVPFTNWGFYNHIFWTLGVEFQFYLLVGLIYFLSKTMSYRVCFLLLFMLSAFVSFPRSYYLVFSYGVIFATGMALSHYLREGAKIYLAIIVLGCLLTFVHFGALICGLIIAAIAIVLYLKVYLGGLKILGDFSYSLYMTHSLLAVYMNGLTKRLIPNQLGLSLPLFAAEILIAILFAYVFYLLIEVPSLRLSKKIVYKSSV